MTATATYSKLNNGTWGVRAAGRVSEGATVTVTKRDGSTKVETVVRVLWTGADNRTGETISLCAIGASTSSTPAPRSGRRFGGGQAANVRGYSSYCTDRAGCRCFDCQ